MTYTSPEVLQLEAIRDWMATLTAWQTWTALDETGSKARIVWPIKAAPALPVCVLALNGGRTVNLTGAAGGSNFQPSGSITLWIYAADTAPTDPQTGYSDFADLFYGLVSAMADAAHVAPVLFNEFSTPDPPIVHSTWVNFEDTDEGLAAWWQGQITIRWGVDQ
mgnify:CR=1 FL=1